MSALDGNLDFSALASDEQEMVAPFAKPDLSKKWREGVQKSSFNYLLLDPRVTQNLPVRAKHIGRHQALHLFHLSIFHESDLFQCHVITAPKQNAMFKWLTLLRQDARHMLWPR